MIGIANTKPIALSTVEGCAQSPRYNVLKIGIVEGWNDGLMRSKSNIPMFQYSNAPLRADASEIFLSSLQTEFFSNLLGAGCDFDMGLQRLIGSRYLLHDPMDQLICRHPLGEGLIGQHEPMPKYIGHQIPHVLRQNVGASA